MKLETAFRRLMAEFEAQLTTDGFDYPLQILEALREAQTRTLFAIYQQTKTKEEAEN